MLTSLTSLGLLLAAPSRVHHRPPLRTKALRLSLFNASLLIEDAVKAATGNEEYRFGDMTRGAVKQLSGKTMEEYNFGDITKRFAAEAAGKESADDYEFGDITRRLQGEATQGLAALAGKDAEDYKFGDLTRRVLTDAIALVNGLAGINTRGDARGCIPPAALIQATANAVLL